MRLSAIQDAVTGRLRYNERAFEGSEARRPFPMLPAKQRPDYFVRELSEPIAAGGELANPDLADEPDE